MAKPRKPKYRKHSQRNFGFSEVRGERIRFPGVYNSAESLEAYHNLCAKLAHEARQSEPPTPLVATGMTIHELCIGYVEHLERLEPPPSDVEFANECLAAKYLGRKFGTTLAGEFGPLKFAELRDELANTVRKNRFGKPVKSGRHLSRATVNILMFRVRRIFKWATSRELVNPFIHEALKSVAPLRHGKSKASEPRKRTPATVRQVAAAIRSVNPVVADMIRLQWYLGVRGKSLCLATPSQFKPFGKLWEWKPRHKTERFGHDLTVYVGPRCQAILSRYLKRRKPDEHLFTPRDVCDNQRLRDFYVSATYAQAIGEAIKRHNAKNPSRQVPAWTPHQLRHARGHIVRNRFGIEAAQAALGHMSLNSTEVYSERRSSLAKLVAEQTG